MIASLEGNNLVILYMYFTSLVHLKSDLIRGVAFDGKDIVRGGCCSTIHLLCDGNMHVV